MNSVRNIFAGREIIEEEMLARVKFGMIIGEVAAKLGLDEPEFDTEEANYAIFKLPANQKGVDQMQIIRRDEEDCVSLKFYKHYDSKIPTGEWTFRRIPKDTLADWIDLYINEHKWKVRHLADTVTTQLGGEEGVRKLGLEYPAHIGGDGILFRVIRKNKSRIVRIAIVLNDLDLYDVSFYSRADYETARLDELREFCKNVFALDLSNTIVEVLHGEQPSTSSYPENL